MNRTFGKKCIGGHYESEHAPRKPDFSEPKVSPDLGVILPRSYVSDTPKRNHCKVCECKMYEA